MNTLVVETQQYNVFEAKKSSYTIAKIKITYSYKKSKQVAKMATRLLQLFKTNLPPLEAWTKNIATKMADSELRNKDKKWKAKLTHQNT